MSSHLCPQGYQASALIGGRLDATPLPGIESRYRVRSVCRLVSVTPEIPSVFYSSRRISQHTTADERNLAHALTRTAIEGLSVVAIVGMGSIPAGSLFCHLQCPDRMCLTQTFVWSLPALYRYVKQPERAANTKSVPRIRM